MRLGIDKSNRTDRQTTFGERRSEHPLDDRPGRRQSIRADAQHRGVAGSDHPSRVDHDIRTALENEADHPQGRATCLDPPRVVLDGFEKPIALGRRVGPHAQARGHVLDHSSVEAQAGHRPASFEGRRDIGLVDRREVRHDGRVGEKRSRPLEERGDRGVRAVGEATEGLNRVGDRPVSRAEVIGAEMDHRLVRHRETITGSESRGERLIDLDHSVSPDDHRLTGDQADQWLRSPGHELAITSSSMTGRPSSIER